MLKPDVRTCPSCCSYAVSATVGTTNPNARRNEYIQSLELLLDYDGFESLALPPRVRGVSNDAMLAIFVLQSPSSPSISVFLTPD